MSLGYTVNKDKNGILLAYMAEQIPNINLRKLIKLIYLIDERFTIERGFPLTWFDYFAWQKGPVAPEVYDIKNGLFSEYVTCVRDENGKCIINSVIQTGDSFQMDLFSQYEINLIDEVISFYGNKTADELTDITHLDNSLWSKAVKENHIDFSNNGKSKVKIFLNKLNEGDVEKEEIYEDALEYMQFCNAASVC